MDLQCFLGLKEKREEKERQNEKLTIGSEFEKKWGNIKEKKRRQYSPWMASATLAKFYQSPLAEIDIQDNVSLGAYDLEYKSQLYP